MSLVLGVFGEARHRRLSNVLVDPVVVRAHSAPAGVPTVRFLHKTGVELAVSDNLQCLALSRTKLQRAFAYLAAFFASALSRSAATASTAARLRAEKNGSESGARAMMSIVSALIPRQRWTRSSKDPTAVSRL